MLLPYLEANRIEAGCDEAGRGCLAGPVYAAAVILPPDFHNEDLNDSKQLSEKKRYALRQTYDSRKRRRQISKYCRRFHPGKNLS